MLLFVESVSGIESSASGPNDGSLEVLLLIVCVVRV